MSDYDPEYIGRYNPDQAAIRADERRKVLDVLAPIMEEAGQALFDDTQFRGASSFEVATGLQVVADALSMRGPIQYYDTLCGGDDA